MGVVVLGMHRSGTSAATRVINLLGVPLCRPSDLVPSHDGNERGHWECLPLVGMNEQLLRDLESRWWCPPDDLAEVAALATDDERATRATRTFQASHPTTEWVWKDPRLSVLLPFWRRVLPTETVALMMYRDPLEVARSLHSRSDVTPRFGLALWERYVALAVRGAEGLPTLYCSYQSLLDDPVAWAGRVAAFLSEHGVPATLPNSAAGIRAFVSQQMRHASRPARPVALSPAQEQWQAFLRRRSQDEVALTPDPEADSATRALMNQVRVSYGLASPAPTATGPRDPVQRVVVAEPRTGRHPPGHGAVSVLLFPHGRAATDADAARLRPRFPADAEFVTVADSDDPEVPDAGTTSGGLLRVQRPGRMSLAARLDLAREVAAGELIVVLAGAPVTPRPGWLPTLRTALNEHPDAAVVAPAMCGTDGTDPVYGLTIDPVFVDVDWQCDTTSPRDAFPIWAATVTALVTTRRHLEAIGGFDASLSGAGREDMDLCLRLWRTGWQCLAVPAAEVVVDVETPDADDVDLLVNLLRLGTVHLSRERLREQVASVAGCEGFATALARVTASDAGRRRGVVDAQAWYATDELSRVTGLPMTDTAVPAGHDA